MRRLLAFALAALLASGCGESASRMIPDRDCGDFALQQYAQEFYVSQGGPDKDPHHLDLDRDGIACESLP